MNDDQRQAVGLKVGISNYVATAALAVLAGSLALFTYISQSFKPPVSFFVLMGLTAGMLVTAIFVGGLGADETVAEAASGTWRNQSIWQFEAQAGLTLLALLLLIAATAVGASSPTQSTAAERRVQRVEQRATRLSDRVLELQRQQRELQRRLRSLQRSNR